jgi:site-specific recombinase XerD
MSNTRVALGGVRCRAPEAAVAALLAWQLRQAGDAEAWQSDWHLFTIEDGRPLDPTYVTRRFQKLRRQGEPMAELTFHGLRHTAASLMLAGGADISRVSNLLGHASISLTADVYAHLVAASGQKAVDGAANLIAAHTLLTRVSGR